MNDESSIFHVEIAGPIADIHKLSSWVVVVIIVFSFAVKYTVLTMHNRFLRSMSSLSTPIKKNGKRIINKESVIVHLYKAGELSSRRIYIGKLPKAIKETSANVSTLQIMRQSLLSSQHADSKDWKTCV